MKTILYIYIQHKPNHNQQFFFILLECSANSYWMYYRLETLQLCTHACVHVHVCVCVLCVSVQFLCERGNFYPR